MTRKDYEVLARTLASYRRVAASGVDGQALLRCIALDLADNLTRENPRFQRDVFLAAAGQGPATMHPVIRQ